MSGRSDPVASVAEGPSTGGRLRLVLVLLVVMAAAVFVALRLQVTTDIGRFLPTGTDREKARISRAVANSEASRTLIVTVEAGDLPAALEASAALEHELRADEALMDALAFVEAGPPADVDRVLWALYSVRRLAFSASSPEAAAALITPEGLTTAVDELRGRLASPLSTLVSRVAPEDPFLSVPRLLERMQQGRADTLAVVDGRFVAAERYAVLIIGTHASAFDAPAQRVVLAGLRAAHARVAARLEVGPLERSGVAGFSIRAEETIKADIQRTTTLSLLGLVLLCLLVLRSFRLVLLTLLPIGCAVLVATAASQLVWGEVHGLTFAFGASLIGVCVDYVVHFYVHHDLCPDPQGARGTLRRIWPALALGACTTAVGFGVIAGSSFPGLRQVATFATVGVVTALVSTAVLLPPLMARATRTPNSLRDRMAHALGAGFQRLRGQRGGSAVLLAAALAASVWGGLAVRWEDDLGQMTRLDPELLAEDERVRARVARFDQGRFIVALGDTEEEALQHDDAVGEALAAAIEAGELGGWQGLSTLLPSATRQQQVDAVLRNDPGLPARLRTALAAGGFYEDSFAPFFAYLDEPPPAPLRYRDLAESAAAPLVRSLRIEVDDRIGMVTFVRDVTDPEALARRIEAVDGAVLVDQGAVMASAMSGYRKRTVELLGLGLLAVAALVGWRYRSLRRVLAVLAPAVLAAGTTLAVLAALDRGLDLVGLTAILMILSIGVDYSVFLAETHHETDDSLPATLLALVVCWLTTVLGFGVLALSEHPIMNTIGVVAAVGVTASLVLAPITLALLPPWQRGAS